VSGGRFALAIGVLVAVGISAPAAAFPRLHHHRSVSSVLLVHDGATTVISVTFSGRRPHTRVLHVDNAVDAVAIRRVDGRRLGIFAATTEGRLLLWKQSGRGEFVQATVPQRRLTLNGAARLRPGRHEDAPDQFGDLRDTAAMPGMSAPSDRSTVAARLSCDATSATSSPIPPASGRAPPREA
jgi:hypothetical protein